MPLPCSIFWLRAPEHGREKKWKRWEKPAWSRLHRESNSLATCTHTRAIDWPSGPKVRTGSLSATRFSTWNLEPNEGDQLSATLFRHFRLGVYLNRFSQDQARELEDNDDDGDNNNDKEEEEEEEEKEASALYSRNRGRERCDGTPPRCQILFIASWLFVSR